MTFKTFIKAKHALNAARVTQVTTDHGTFVTPTFMPVGTRAGVNCLTHEELHQTQSQIILGGNTFHMLVAPGTEIIKASGGMHTMMGWDAPMLTDSGGFQVFSLSKRANLCTIDEKGASFKLSGQEGPILLTPECSIETQKIIGADIIMAFDQCVSDSASYDEQVAAIERTERWLMRSRTYHAQNPRSAYGHSQALFGIIQGGVHRNLRERCAEYVVGLDFDGIAVGGETVGFNMEKTQEIIDWVRPILPEEKTRYSMGVGLNPQDLLDVIACGIDIFDCVAPTRNARHGALYSGIFEQDNGWPRFVSEKKNGCVQIKKRQYSLDEAPIMADCECYTCANYSKAALHHLFKSGAPLYAALGSLHNVFVMQKACHLARDAIHATA